MTCSGLVSVTVAFPGLSFLHGKFDQKRRMHVMKNKWKCCDVTHHLIIDSNVCTDSPVFGIVESSKEYHMGSFCSILRSKLLDPY